MLSTKENAPIDIGDRDVRILGDRVLIEEIPESETTPGGLIKVMSKKTMYRRGKVVAVGSGTLHKSGKIIPVAVSVGDEVVFSYLSAVGVKKGDQVLKIITEANIFLVVEKDDDETDTKTTL